MSDSFRGHLSSQKFRPVASSCFYVFFSKKLILRFMFFQISGEISPENLLKSRILRLKAFFSNFGHLFLNQNSQIIEKGRLISETFFGCIFAKNSAYLKLLKFWSVKNRFGAFFQKPNLKISAVVQSAHFQNSQNRYFG